jgi:ribonuclease HIII
MDVLVDQFAPLQVMESALDVPASGIRLTQRSKAEDDIAVAAASILARAAFVEAIEDFRAKSGLIIPFGASAPEVISVAREIVRRWGEPGLARIAKVNFKTTHEVLGTS